MVERKCVPNMLEVEQRLLAKMRAYFYPAPGGTEWFKGDIAAAQKMFKRMWMIIESFQLNFCYYLKDFSTHYVHINAGSVLSKWHVFSKYIIYI